MPAFKDLTGLKFHKLTFVKFIRMEKIRPRVQRAVWLVRCDCGNEFEYYSNNICKGNKKYCNSNVHMAEKMKNSWDARGRKLKGYSSHPLYATYDGMMRRCYDKRAAAYPLYGGRGIAVCDEWRNDIEKFIVFCEQNGWKPNSGLTIDRINNNGNYEPNNVRIATAVTQNNNTRRNRMISFNGLTMTMAEWAKYLNIPYGRLQTRIQRGYQIEKALSRNYYRTF
jgi:hypothetical protein